ncbi:radical SAM protein [Poriferisphaera corsica]|nr:radical SAM protein [Poriferisphaera corsica]
MIKPVGAACNLDCTYCYYLPTHDVYGDRAHRMHDVILEEIFRTILPEYEDHVSICWQGGEPTLAGIEFYEKAMGWQEKYKRPGQVIENLLQTNGTLLDDEWGAFLSKNRFLVGLSCDGPPHLHDKYRYTVKGDASSDKVLRGLDVLKKHGVEYNILCVLNDVNVKHPELVYNYVTKLGSRYVQFIPAIEWEDTKEDYVQGHAAADVGLKKISPSAVEYGQFLCKAFDMWNTHHRTHLSIQLFDVMLNQYLFSRSTLCINSNACHNQLTIEYDGSVYGCDHYVNHRWQLGHVSDRDWRHKKVDDTGMVALTVSAGDEPDEDWYEGLDRDVFETFAKRKLDLPEKDCGRCEYQRFCYGGCPKHRPRRGEVTEKTVLCEGYKLFFEHAMPTLEKIATHYRHYGELPATEAEIERQKQVKSGVIRPGQKVKPNELCPCGSGMKFKKCCKN